MENSWGMGILKSIFLKEGIDPVDMQVSSMTFSRFFPRKIIYSKQKKL